MTSLRNLYSEDIDRIIKTLQDVQNTLNEELYPLLKKAVCNETELLKISKKINDISLTLSASIEKLGIDEPDISIKESQPLFSLVPCALLQPCPMCHTKVSFIQSYFKGAFVIKCPNSFCAYELLKYDFQQVIDAWNA